MFLCLRLDNQNNQKKNSVYPIILRIQWFTADLPGFTWGSLLTHPTRAENVLNTPLLPTKSSPSLLPTRVLGLFNQYKLIRGWRSNSGKVLLGSLLQQEGSKRKQQLSLLAGGGEWRGRWVVVSLFLIQSKGSVQGSDWRGGSGGLPTS